jgi:pentatricopeptide repeat protein
MIRSMALPRRSTQRTTCWKTHLIRTLTLAADRSWTTAVPAITHSPQGELFKRAMAQRRVFAHTQTLGRLRFSRHLSYNSHLVFNLASSLELSHLVQALKMRQCERAWSIYRSLRKSSRNPAIPTEVVGDLYALLRYAGQLTVTEQAASKKDQQVESILNDVELSGIGKEEFLTFVNDILISEYKLLHRAIRAKEPEAAITIFRHMVTMGDAKKLTRSWIYQLLDLFSQGKESELCSEVIEYVTKNQLSNLTEDDLKVSADIYSQFKSKNGAEATKRLYNLIETGEMAGKLEHLMWVVYHWKQYYLLEDLFQAVKADGTIPGCESYVFLMRHYQKSKQHTKALETFQELMSSDMKPSVQAFNVLLQVFSDQRATDRISIMLQAMIDRGYQPDAASFSEAMKANAQAGNLHACIEYYHMMRDLNIQPNIYSYNILINAFSEARNTPEVIHWFQAMLADGILPNHVTITTLIKAFASEDPEATARNSIRIFEQAVATGIKPDVVLYTTLIKMYADSANMQAALSIHSDMLAVGINPNVYTYTSLIEACVNTSQMDVAQKIFHLMKETEHKQPNAFTYCVMLQAWMKVQDADKIKEFYQEAIHQVQSGAIEEDHVLIDCLSQAKMCLGEETEMTIEVA